jgi:hypothetical protein
LEDKLKVPWFGAEAGQGECPLTTLLRVLKKGSAYIEFKTILKGAITRVFPY